MGTKAHGRILVWEGASLWIFSAAPGEHYPKTDVHSHHVLQLTLALTGRVDFDSGAERVGGQAVAIAPDAPHAFEATGLVVHLFVASDGKAGREIVRALCSSRPVAPIPLDTIGDFATRLKATFEDPRHTDDDLRALGRGLIARLAGESVRAQPIDPRIAKMIEWVAARLDRAVSLRDVTELVGLSEGRTHHGSPRRWLRRLGASEPDVSADVRDRRRLTARVLA